LSEQYDIPDSDPDEQQYCTQDDTVQLNHRVAQVVRIQSKRIRYMRQSRKHGQHSTNENKTRSDNLAVSTTERLIRSIRLAQLQHRAAAMEPLFVDDDRLQYAHEVLRDLAPDFDSSADSDAEVAPDVATDAAEQATEVAEDAGIILYKNGLTVAVCGVDKRFLMSPNTYVCVPTITEKVQTMTPAEYAERIEEVTELSLIHHPRTYELLDKIVDADMQSEHTLRLMNNISNEGFTALMDALDTVHKAEDHELVTAVERVIAQMG